MTEGDQERGRGGDSGPRSRSLPMVIYPKVKLGFSLDINALASLINTAVGACVPVAGYLIHRAERERQADAELAAA